MASAAIQFWTDTIANPDPASWRLPPDPWSVVFIGATLQLLPGLLDNGDVTWRKPPHRIIDKTHKPSTDGSDPTLLGFGTAEFELRMVIHTPAQLAALQAIIPQIFQGKSTPANPGQAGQATNGTYTSQAFTPMGVAPGNGIPGATTTIGLNLTQATPGGGFSNSHRDKAVQVYHPALALAGIKQMLVEKWTPPVRWNGKNDIKMYVLHCLEHRNSTKAKTQKLTQVTDPGINNKTRPPQTTNTRPSQGSAGPMPALGGGFGGFVLR
jgi:hypothetical protein